VGKAQKDWARRERVRLTEVLGGECAACGTKENLEFDCKEPCGDRHHRMDTSMRMCFYRKQHALGNVQLLCQLHNNRKSIDDRWAEKFTKWAGTLTQKNPF